MKMVFLVADGMGDWPVAELGDRTPMAAAEIPAMDAMAKQGVVGTARTVPQGMEPGSDVANMALLGYDPAQYHTGRGPIEAAAQGLDLAPDDLVWRMNLVTVSGLSRDGTMLDYSAGHIASEQSVPLVQGLQNELGSGTFTFYPGVQYRHLLVQKGGASTPMAGLKGFPPHDLTDKSIADAVAGYEAHPELWTLIQAAAGRLAADGSTKANTIWPWGQGTPLALPAFAERTGMSGAVVSAVDLIRGLGSAAGMEVLEVEGVTGLVDTNYEGKTQAALDFLQRGDFVFVHLEGPDECGHGGDAQCKVTALERIDARVLTPMREALEGQPVLFVVTCDHLTPLAIKTHDAGPVPFLAWWEGMQGSGVAEVFTEEQCAKGETVEQGYDLLSWALNLAREKMK